MKKYITILIGLIAITVTAQADKYFTKTGKISFYSKAPMETIEANNGAVGVLLNTETNELNFSVLVKSFVFEKKLMQEHFNENYMDSDKYPKAKFSGKVKNMSSVNFDKDGTYPVQVSGTLSIHGKSNKVNEKGFIVVKNGTPAISSIFNITLTDYNVKIPRAVKDKIAKDVKIKIVAGLKKL
jgi:polyisoprenoid-binding protein YceI